MKKVLSILLAAALCICLLSTVAFAATPLQNQIKDGAKITLTANEKLSAALVIPQGVTVTIDLNGYNIDRGLKSAKAGGNVITVYGNLTIVDKTGKGAITGGYTTGSGGGIYIANGGSVTVNGANITNNKTKDCGGGVFAVGTFVMNGGSITNNTASQRGGGIYIFGDKDNSKANQTPTKWCEINKATVSGNKAGANGGGIYVHYYDMDLKMSNTVVTLNTAGNIGGGIYGNRTLNLGSGNSVVLNSAKVSLTDNIYSPTQVKSNEGSTLDFFASVAVTIANKLFGR